MNIENINTNEKISHSGENFKVELTDHMLYDRLHTLSVEYSISVEWLVNVAVKRLIEEVDFVRDLRAGKTEPR